jgi:acetyl esterase/lipase
VRKAVAKKLGLGAMAATLMVMATACYPPVAFEDPYVAIVHSIEEITPTYGVVYDRARDENGQIVDLALDVFQPPMADGEVRPTLVFFHGGAYQFGSRDDMHLTAALWVQRGYVAVTPSYRLSPGPVDLRDPAPALLAASDGQMVVKWLRANAADYGIDPDRLAVLGSSAGGVIATMTASSVDLTDARHDGPESHVATAAVATGAPALPLVEAEVLAAETVAAPLVFEHHEDDLATNYTDEDARRICGLWMGTGERCELSISAGRGHTVSLDPFGAISLPLIMPMLAAELDLANAPVPVPVNQ